MCSAAQKNVRAFLSRGGIEALLNLMGNGGSDVRLRVLQLTRTLFEVDEAEVRQTQPCGEQAGPLFIALSRELATLAYILTGRQSSSWVSV